MAYDVVHIVAALIACVVARLVGLGGWHRCREEWKSGSCECCKVEYEAHIGSYGWSGLGFRR